MSVFLKFGLDSSKIIGRAYDGCPAIAGKISDVIKRIQDKYLIANVFILVHIC